MDGYFTNEATVHMIFLSALPLFLYYRSGIDCFLHATFALVAMSFVRYMELSRGYNNAIFASMLAFVFIVNIKQLSVIEKSGKSIPEILKLKRYDQVFVLLFFAFWFLLKTFMFGS